MSGNPNRVQCTGKTEEMANHPEFHNRRPAIWKKLLVLLPALGFLAGYSVHPFWYAATNSIGLENRAGVRLIDPNDGPYSIEVIRRNDGSRDYWWEIDNPAVNIVDGGLALYLREEKETMTRIGAEQPSNGIDTTETPSGRNIKQTSDTVRTNAPAKQVLTKVRTKIKSIDTVLKKAAIESYCINGQIEGLRISGLDKILAAKELLLKSGDIIRVVNGQPLSSKIRAYKIFKRKP